MIDITPLERAIEQLETSMQYTRSDLAKQDAGIAKQFRAAAIQAFEFTYELSYRMLKRYLQEIEANPEDVDQFNFQDLIRLGFEKGLLRNSWDEWQAYRKARGTTSHIYNEDLAEKVFGVLPKFLTEAKYLRDQINNREGKI
jgi:nucleotidyltransferase substrate binding protein (TIGR01987 family)